MQEEKGSKKELILITNTYPFGVGESFIESEIDALCSAFDTVWVLPLKGRKGFTDAPPRSVPANAHVWIPKVSVIDMQLPGIRNLFPALRLFFKTGILELGRYRSALKWLKPRNMAISLIRANRAVTYQREFKRFLEDNVTGDHIVYSYWLDTWLTGLLDLRNCGKIAMPIVSRAHGGDLYYEASSVKYQTFRQYIYRYIDAIYPISTAGYNYLVKDAAHLTSKMEVRYLGVVLPKEWEQLPEDQFLLVSCSFLKPVKRVKLILESLNEIPENYKVNYIHIGNGPQMEELVQFAKTLPAHISVTWAGYLNQSELYAFYASKRVNCFVNVSESEGLPVSIMEALCFGIPIIATDVGGTSDAVNAETGFLLTKDFHVNELTEKICYMYDLDPVKRKVLETGARRLAREKFDAERNFADFARLLSKKLSR